jgi:hypothetical protein
MADIRHTLFTVVLIAVICLFGQMLTGCASTDVIYSSDQGRPVITYYEGDDLVIMKFMRTKAQVNAKCGFKIDVYGCTKHYKDAGTYLIYTLPVDCIVQHELKHVKDWNWHHASWIDDKCNRAARVYLADLKHKRV